MSWTSSEVLRLYIVASKEIIDVPEKLQELELYLGFVSEHVCEPAYSLAQECLEWFTLFAAYVRTASLHDRKAAGVLFFEKMEHLAQKIDLPPLDEWENWPSSVELAGPWPLTEVHVSQEPLLERLRTLSESDRAQMYQQAIGQGVLSRSEALFLQQRLRPSLKLSEDESGVVALARRLEPYLNASGAALHK